MKTKAKLTLWLLKHRKWLIPAGILVAAGVAWWVWGR